MYKNHIYIKLNDHINFIFFNIVFNNLINMIKDLNINTTSTLYFIMYIMAVFSAYFI